jgi:hypothetical protein
VSEPNLQTSFFCWGTRCYNDHVVFEDFGVALAEGLEED